MRCRKRKKRSSHLAIPGLEEALIGFIEKAITNKWGIRAAFYEFTYLPVLEALQRAVQKGCDVQIVYDSRKEAEENDESIKDAGLKRSIKKGQKTIKILFRRTKDPQVPSHNKFMVLMDGTGPAEVWTGSTNITDKGIFGHSNVGHIVRDRSVAKQYFKYWESLHWILKSQTLKKVSKEFKRTSSSLMISARMLRSFLARARKRIYSKRMLHS
jgi:phosphatidylserine/phosphatidylglycerophosphate/cardiolipin synthase-like enzyme